MENPEEDVDILEVKNREIKFKSYTQRYGRAYWHIGVERKEEGIIEAVYFIPSQQPDEENIYKYLPENDDHVAFELEPSPYLMKKTNPKNSLDHSKTKYCHHHDLVEESWCMPIDASILKITEYGSGIQIEVRE